MRFSTMVEQGGKTATGLEVPPEVVESLGSGRGPAVTVTINGHGYRSTIAARGGRYLLPLSAENRAAAGVSAGEPVEVDVALDTAPRAVEAPADLAAALAEEPAAQARFEALSYSNQRRHVLAIEGAKAPETRARRVRKAVEELRAGG